MACTIARAFVSFEKSLPICDTIFILTDKETNTKKGRLVFFTHEILFFNWLDNFMPVIILQSRVYVFYTYIQKIGLNLL